MPRVIWAPACGTNCCERRSGCSILRVLPNLDAHSRHFSGEFISTVANWNGTRIDDSIGEISFSVCHFDFHSMYHATWGYFYFIYDLGSNSAKGCTAAPMLLYK
ncbi:hypothetical protein I7I50_06239 [Histoplasma capsulatum G186AR]|uniref:Uncharacterized protein n=1 Tax=Ajellomyces capsulatus TaxID=5037 RepID=A0A8H7YZT8_AJECA|nr:hypothetical protein I7I52_10688 [Histoplasma capsulatum]QSS67225.1 hypothetical protein I7I50_06239 [Histoplasma capsulatum G186AR]